MARWVVVIDRVGWTRRFSQVLALAGYDVLTFETTSDAMFARNGADWLAVMLGPTEIADGQVARWARLGIRVVVLAEGAPGATAALRPDAPVAEILTLVERMSRAPVVRLPARPARRARGGTPRPVAL